MTRPVPMLFALACLTVECAHAEAVPAPITAVVLYPGSAMIERSATVKAGLTELDISGLPANFDVQTVRAQGSNGIQVGQIVMRDSGKADAPGAREAELEATLQALQDSRDAVGVDAKSATVVQNYLDRLNGAGGGDKGGPIDAKSVSGVIEAIHRGAHDAFSEIHRTEIQMRDIDRKIAAVQRDLERARSGARDARSITIHLAAHQAGTLKLFYQVNGAGWRPAYRAALDTTASTIELERMASVSQKTGEDWNGVSLKLSSGQPRLSPQPPQPQPRLLAYFKPVPPAESALAYNAARSSRQMAPAAPAPLPPADARSTKPGAANDYTPPSIELQDNFSTEFTVPERVSLAADGREISVPLSRLSLPAKQRIRIVPRMDRAAFLTAETSRPAGVWLSGDIQLFRDGDFVGGTRWDAGSGGTGEQLLFPFGRDDLIRVSVDRAGEESASTGLLIQRGQRQVSDVYTISSAHQTPVDLEVLEASPVSTSDEIRVTANYAPQPTVETWERKRGVVAWDKIIAPKEVWKLKVDYTISYPTEGSVTGLP